MKYAIALLAIGLFSLSAMARMPGPDQAVAHLTNVLDLSDEQATRIQAIMTAKQTQFASLLKQMAALHEQTDVEIKAVLTAEQVKKFDALAQQRQQHRMPREGEF